MHVELGRVQHSLPPWLIALSCFFLVAVQSAPVLTQYASKTDKAVRVNFEDRLRFYLDQKSKAFLVDMAAKEKLLLQMIQNIYAEIKKRGVEAILEDQPGFKTLYRDIDRLVEEYEHEIEQIKKLIDEIAELEALMIKEKRYGMADLIADLKDSLAALIDSRSLHKKLRGTASYVSDLLKEYDLEVDYFIKLYNNLIELEKEAQRRNDYDLLDRIARQKQKILQYIALTDISKKDSLSERLVNQYIDETRRVVDVLKELEAIEKEAASKAPEAILDIELLRRDLLTRMDRRLLRMFGYDNYLNLEGPTVSELFDEWRKARLAKYEAKYAEYLVIKKFLLKSGDGRQRARMLERDLSDALLNYANEEYALAEDQLKNILQHYSDYFDRFESVYFFIAEAQYAQLHYEQAYKSYLKLLQQYPNTQFRDDVYLRLLTIAQTLNHRQDFYNHYTRFLEFADQANPKIRNRLHYLAGYYFLQLKDTKAAEAALARIEKGSRYYYPGLYLTGLALVNQGAYEGAVRIFNLLVNAKNLPWTDPVIPFLKNNALLKLGYIYYERGDYATALEYFNRVSKGADERDKVLMGIAWASMKTNDYDQAIQHLNELFKNFISSHYTYEAMVLAAHCKRLINQPDDALHNLRYVANARGVLDLSDRYNEERRKLLLQLDELENMEKQVLERQDRQLYDVISEIKYALQKQLINLGFEGGVGSRLIQEFDAERMAIYRQIQELENIIKKAKETGNNEVYKAAVKRRDRLVKALETYQADKDIKKVNYFLDYPLATQESVNKYRRKILQELMQELELEKARIEKNFQKAKELVAKNPDAARSIDLLALQEDLENLQDRIDRFQTWLSEHQVEEIETDFNRWADFSGFGMSDITIQEMQKREQKISMYTENVAFIEELMRQRRMELEERLRRFDEEMEKIRKELEAEQIRLKKLEHEKIFESLYFDTSTSETEDRAANKSSSE